MKPMRKRLIKKISKNKILDEVEKEYLEVRRNAERFNAFFPAFKGAFPQYKMEPSRTGRQFSLWIYLKDLEGFKDEKLADLMGYLLDKSPVHTSSNEYLANYNIDYKFEFNGFYIMVGAYIKSDSPTCRRIQVGEDTHYSVVPRYIIECD